MARATLSALLLTPLLAFAQVDGGTPAPAPEAAPANAESVRREVDEKLEATKRELKDQLAEIRGQYAAHAASQEWQDAWVEQKRKLELFTLDGYLRLRPDLFHKFDLARAADPDGFRLWDTSPTGAKENTQAGANLRLRLDPALNVSEEVRVQAQVDVLDNLVLGTTPDSRLGSDRTSFDIFSESQSIPRSGINAVRDSISVRRVYGEVGTPVGILRFGRMGSHWGLGMLRNDGNCLDCDHGDTVDRVQFVTEPLPGLYVTPMLDFNAEGPSSVTNAEGGQAYDLSNRDDANGLVLAVARRDTDAQARARLDNGLAVFNYGLHFTYRFQSFEPVPATATSTPTPDSGASQLGFISRKSVLYVPDVWVKYERKAFRLELEAAAQIGSINNRALLSSEAGDITQNQALSILQFGAVAQGEYRFMDGALRLGMEVGFASGDKAPGLGNRPGRRLPRDAVTGRNGETVPGNIDGPQVACQATGACTDNSIDNFRFNRDYRVDMILWREMLGPVTDAVYVKPGIKYQLADGFHLFGDVIYSRTVYAESSPSGVDPNLGVEVDAGLRYETEDGFFAQLRWGILFPLKGLDVAQRPAGDTGSLETAQALRGLLGIRF
jgi:uncharacterized protein (TIGR04551 family)